MIKLIKIKISLRLTCELLVKILILARDATDGDFDTIGNYDGVQNAKEPKNELHDCLYDKKVAGSVTKLNSLVRLTKRQGEEKLKKHLH